MKKRILFVALAIVMLSLTACTANPGDDLFNDYSFTNPTTVEKNWRDLETDDIIEVDGELNEEAWGLLNWQTIYPNAGGELQAEVRFTAYLSETGIYLAMIAYDEFLNNSHKDLYENTSVEFHIADAKAISLSKNVVQLRFGADGALQQWRGIPLGSYAYIRAHIDVMSRVKLFSDNPSGQAPTFNAHVEGQGWQLEAFMPWYEIEMYSGVPEEIRVGVAYNYVPIGLTREQARADGMNHTSPSSFNLYNKDGWITTGPGYLMGNTANGNVSFPMSGGWRTVDDTAETFESNTTTVRSTAAGLVAIYAKDFAGTKFFFETELTYNRNLVATEQYPKFGIILGGAEVASTTRGIFFCVDGANSATKQSVIVNPNSTFREGGYSWRWNENHESLSVPGIIYKTDHNGTAHFVKLGVLRDGAKMYFFVNGMHYPELDLDGVSGFLASQNSVVGLYGFNSDITYKNIKLVSTSSAVDAIKDSYSL